MFKRKIIVFLILLVLVFSLVLAACSGKTSASQGPKNPVGPTWIEAAVESDVVSVSLDQVQQNVMSNFAIKSSGTTMSFMSYLLGDKVYVRADICPPCRSKSFSLLKDTLVCDACGTVFNATTGSGVSGACVRFPKAEVSYELADGSLVMQGTDLLTAYQNTLQPGRP